MEEMKAACRREFDSSVAWREDGRLAGHHRLLVVAVEACSDEAQQRMSVKKASIAGLGIDVQMDHGEVVAHNIVTRTMVSIGSVHFIRLELEESSGQLIHEQVCSETWPMPPTILGAANAEAILAGRQRFASCPSTAGRDIESHAVSSWRQLAKADLILSAHTRDDGSNVKAGDELEALSQQFFVPEQVRTPVAVVLCTRATGVRSTSYIACMRIYSVKSKPSEICTRR